MPIHGQFPREDRLDETQRLGAIPALFPMHTVYWATGTSTARPGRRTAASATP